MVSIIFLVKAAIWVVPIGFIVYEVIKFGTAKNVSVQQGEVAIVEDTLTGKLRILPFGLHPINQFHERVLRDSVSMKNEPRDPKPVEVKTKNLTGVIVDLVIIKNMIVDPIKATTKVDYDRLDSIVTDRINVLIQRAFGKADLEDIFEEEAVDDDDGKGNIVKRPKRKKINAARVEDLLNTATSNINEELARIADAEWGMEVEIAIQNFFLPEKLQEVAEDIVTTDAEAEKTTRRASALGLTVSDMLKLDAQTQIGGLIVKALGGAFSGKGGKS